MNCAALTAVSTLKLMSTLTPVTWSVSLMIGTWEGEKMYNDAPYNVSRFMLGMNMHQLQVTYCSFVKDFDGIQARHVVFVQCLFQFLQWGVVPLSKHHQVNVTRSINAVWTSMCLAQILQLYQSFMLDKSPANPQIFHIPFIFNSRIDLNHAMLYNSSSATYHGYGISSNKKCHPEWQYICCG